MQGGTRSGKTVNILLWFVTRLLKEENKVLTIVRDSLPSLKGSVLRDFIDLLTRLGMYSENNHNKTENTYMLGTNLIEFVSCDQPHKIRGRKRNYLFCNEATELSYDSWLQLIFRTEDRTVIDYNPSEIDHWIYDHVLSRPDVDFYITTYKDNPFLSDDLVHEIERLQEADPDYWKIYGLGERGTGRELIFTHYRLCDSMPSGKVFYGCDLGFNHKTALIRCIMSNDAIYAQEVVYQSRLTTTDLAGIMKGERIEKNTPIYFDYADPRSAEELTRHGFKMIPCAAKNVRESIMAIKSKPLNVMSDSANLIKELKNYSWKKDKTGMILDEPVKYLDDAVDALRYAVFTHLMRPQINAGAIML
jgi:phage terminase large subunit